MKKITILTVGLLGANFLFSQKFQGFEKSGSDNWKFTTNYARYNLLAFTDQWADTSETGVNSGSDIKVSARTGGFHWGMRDLNNPVTSASPRHYMDFEAVDISKFATTDIEFYYFTNAFDASDTIGYIVEYDTLKTWNRANLVEFSKDSKAWTKVSISVPAGKSYVRLRIYALQDGASDWAAIDDFKLTGSNVDKTAPFVSKTSIENLSTVKIAFNEMLSNSADSITNYSISPSATISSAMRSSSPGADTVTLSFSPALTAGKYYTITAKSNIKDTAGNPMAADYSFTVVYNNTTPDLAITEIMYNSPSSDPDTLDFIEIVNRGNTAAALGGLTFHNGGITLLPEVTLNPGAFYLMGMDSNACKRFYGKPFGQYTDALSNGGEPLFIRNTLGKTIDSVNYDDAAPWTLGPPSPDGGGPSLEIIDYRLENNDASNWRISGTKVATWNGTTDIFATPGSSVLPIIPTVVFSSPVQYVNESVDSVFFTLRVTTPNSNSIQAKVALVSKFGTAQNDSDFIWKDSIYSIPANFAGDVKYGFALVKDSKAEADENFALRLSVIGNGVTGSTKDQTVFIIDNDQPVINPVKNIALKFAGRYSVPGTGNSAEISAYDPGSKRLYVVNSLKNTVHMVDMKDPSNPKEIKVFDATPYGELTSVAIHNGILAVACPSTTISADGKLLLLDTGCNLKKTVTVGVLPDMVTFSPDGKKILTANEAQPETDYSQDAEGSVSIIDISAGLNSVDQSKVTTVDFKRFNANATALKQSGIRAYGVGNTFSQDMEPEYITFSSDSRTAYVTLQENNAIAVVNLQTNRIDTLLALGTKDFSLAQNSADVNDQGSQIVMAAWPVKAFYSPDAAQSFSIGGKDYLVTANEGDYREYDALTEELRVSAMKLDSTRFPEQGLLKAGHNLGRLTVTGRAGDTDGDGDIDEIMMAGSRSFSIWSAADMKLQYDSKNDFERYTATDTQWRRYFNASNTTGAPAIKNRSDNKGPEPEGVAIGVINDTAYAFIALERTGGVMVYNVQNPLKPVFVDYINTRLPAGGGDLGSEGILFIPANESPTGKHMIVLSNEVSATVSMYEVSGTYPVATATLNKANVTITEGAVAEKLTVQLDKASNYATRVVLSVSNTTASAADYSTTPALTGDSIVVTIPKGATTSEISLLATDDTEIESTEAASVSIRSVSFGATKGSAATCLISIADNDKATGVKKQTLDGIAFYPIPADAVLNLTQMVEHISIANMQGQVVLTAEKTTHINVAKLPAGLYNITLNHGATGRLLIQH